jgi:hypothetical protein
MTKGFARVRVELYEAYMLEARHLETQSLTSGSGAQFEH